MDKIRSCAYIATFSAYRVIVPIRYMCLHTRCAFKVRWFAVITTFRSYLETAWVFHKYVPRQHVNLGRVCRFVKRREPKALVIRNGVIVLPLAAHSATLQMGRISAAVQEAATRLHLVSLESVWDD